MPLFTIDPEKCNRDGICAAECPVKIITMPDREAVPVPTADAGELCINCGHCVAVCPTGALALETMTPADCPPVKPEWHLDADRAEHFLRSRRSARVFKADPVPRETLTRLIRIASHAPSGHNRQPVRWQVIYDTDELKTLNGLVVDWMRYMIQNHPDAAAPMHLDRVVLGWEVGMDTICRGAPHVIVAHGATADPTAQTACTIAQAYLELAAAPLGLGACWAGFFNAAATFWPPMKNALALPAGHAAYGSMMVGYTRFRYHRLPLRNAPEIAWR